MAIVLDESTRAQYIAQTLASSRASVVVSALGSTVYCEVYDGTNVLRATGTMASPWATSSGATITIGEVDSAGLIVSSGGVPDSLWYAQFRGSNGRFVRGTFGVSGSGEDFTWNQSTFQTGSKGTLGTVTLTADGVTGVAPVNSSLPAISGTAQVGLVLSASTGTWANTPTSYSYQWQRSSTGTSGWSNISGATSSTYTLTSTDLGQYVRVSVTASNDYGSGSAFSAASAAVIAAPTTGTITTFQLTSSIGGTNLPWAFGHGFKQGDVPSGTDVVGDSTDFQATPTTYWPDGSVRHAIIAGRSTFSSPSTVTVTLSRGTASNVTALAISDLKAAIPSSTSITVGGTTMTLAGTFLDTPQRTVCTGPVMSNWIYRLAVSGSNHLVIWCDVRLYKGGTVELFPWVENAYLTVASPTSTTGTACSVTVGGLSRFSQSINISHHSRVPLFSGSAFSYWSSDPQIVPKHNAAYLRDTKLVPNYGWTNPSATTLNALQQTYSPNTLAGVSQSMGDAGTSASLLPLPAALYCTSGDSRAYKAAVVFGMSGGSWPTHYRDDATNEPIAFSSRPNVSLNDGGSPALPTESGSTNGTPVTTHQPSFGYFPWLITGRWFFLDEHLFWATWNYLKATPDQRKGLIYQQDTANYPAYVSTAAAGIFDPTNGTYTVRGAAWCLRTLAQAATIVPTGHSTYASIMASWDYNVGYWHDRFVSGAYAASATDWTSGLGVLGTYTDYGYAGASVWMGEGWQQGMVEQALGHAWELSPSSTTATKLATTLDESLKLVAGRTGGSSGWNYRHFVVYSMPFGTNSAGAISWYTSMTDAYTTHKATFSLGGLPTGDGLSLKKHSSNTDLTGDTVNDSSWPYWGLAYGALSYAADRSVSNAITGRQRITGASNYTSVSASFNDDPVYGIVPRSGRPAWVTNAPLFTWTEIPNTSLTAVQSSVTQSLGDKRFVFSYSGATLKRTGSEIFIMGGGHADYSGNEVYSLKLNQTTPAWVLRRNTTPSSQISWTTSDAGQAYYSDGRPSSRHTYSHIQYSNERDLLLFVGAYAVWGNGNGGYATFDAFDPSTNDYRPAGTFSFGTGSLGAAGPAYPVCQDSSGNIYSLNGNTGVLAKWTQSTATWSSLGTPGVINQNVPLAHDPIRNRLVMPQNGAISAAYYDLNNGGAKTNFTATGALASKFSSGISLVWCEARSTFLFRPFTEAGNVYELDPVTWAVTQLSVSGTGPTLPPTDGEQKAFGRFMYVPELSIVALVQQTTQNVYFFRVA